MLNSSEGTTNLLACPCCGYGTLDEIGCYDICPVCWWEDEGLDNRFAVDYSPPNRTNLNFARFNFIRHGISDPSRTDLRVQQEQQDGFVRVRIFEISADGFEIVELDPAAREVIIYRGVIPTATYDDFDSSSVKDTKIRIQSPKIKWELKK